MDKLSKSFKKVSSRAGMALGSFQRHQEGILSCINTSARVYYKHVFTGRLESPVVKAEVLR